MCGEFDIYVSVADSYSLIPLVECHSDLLHLMLHL